MTTIAYRDGVLASDSRVHDEARKTYNLAKIHSVPSREALVAAAGNLSSIEVFLEWFRAATNSDRPALGDGSVSAIVLYSDGSVELYEDSVFPIRWPKWDYLAVGSGAQGATVAMHMGKSAAEAVKITAEVDPNSGGKVQTGTWVDGKPVLVTPRVE